MPNATEAWRVTSPPSDDTQPARLETATINLETHLEDWIERDPMLLMPGLALIGRQVNTVAGFVDLMAIDGDGVLVVIELKRGATYRDTVAQALDYAAAVSRWTAAEIKAQAEQYLSERREGGVDAADGWEDLLVSQTEFEPSEWVPGQVRVLVAGNGTDAGVERIVDFLSGRFGVPINAVSFDVFAEGSDLVMVRRAVLSEEESRDRARKIARGGTHEELMGRADASGAKGVAETVLKAWEEAGRTIRVESSYWPIKRPSPEGRQVIAKVYPDDRDAEPGGLYVELIWSKLSEDCGIAVDVLQRIVTGLLDELLEDEKWVWLPSIEEAQVFSKMVARLYSGAEADYEQQGINVPLEEDALPLTSGEATGSPPPAGEDGAVDSGMPGFDG